MANEYPLEAYAPNGVLWWELQFRPPNYRPTQPFGVEQKLAAWLRFNKDIGETFTTKEARSALGESEGESNADEHFQRRLRELRGRDAWSIPSQKYDSSLGLEQYRVEKYGWYPGCGKKRAPKADVSKALKRAVFARDGSTCTICGARNDEPTVDDPIKRVRLTVGHVLSNNYGGSVSIQNLRTECSDCNEPVRSDMAKPESPEEIATAARLLNKADRERLAEWISVGRHLRDKADEVYDRYRMLAPGDMEIAKAEILKIAGRSG